MNKNTEDKNRVISNIVKDSNPTCSDDDWLDKVEVARDTGDVYPDNGSTDSEKKSGGTYEIKTETPRKEQRLFSFLFREYNEDCVRSDMIDVIIPLVPLVVWGIYLFGLRVLTLALISVISCVVLDMIASLILKDKEAASDLSSVVIGLMTVLCLPPTAPLWLPAAAAIISVVFVKHLAGRLTKIRLHPAAAAVSVMYVVFPAIMTALCNTGTKLPALTVTAGSFEKLSSTTLGFLLSGSLPKQSVGSLFVGLRSGMIGEMSALLILAGGVYLCLRKIINPRLPAAFILTVAVLSYIFPRLAIASDTIALQYAAYHILSGNLLFCAFFLSFFPGSAPVSPRAQLAAGIIGGATTFLIRYYVGAGADALIAVLIINLISRPLDLLLKPSVFGGRPKH